MMNNLLSTPDQNCGEQVDAKDEAEPLRIISVQLSSEEAGAQLHAAWAASITSLQRMKQPVLYPTYESFFSLVREVGFLRAETMPSSNATTASAF